MTAVRPAPSARHRSLRWATGGGALALLLALTGCAGGGGTQAPSPSEGTTTAPASSTSATSQPATSPPATQSASASTSASPSESPSGSAGGEGGEGGDPLGLPSPDLEETAYTGEPRAIDEVYAIPCLEALADGEPIPEVEEAPEDENGELAPRPWTQSYRAAATEGWLRCPTEMTGGLYVPAAFEVEAVHQDGVLEGMTLTDATGRTVGGYRAGVEGGAPGTAEILDVVEVTEVPEYAGAGPDETAYLRSLIIDSPSGPHLLVDLVSALAGQDPESLEVWDLGVAGGTVRDVVYGTVPLESAGDAESAREAIDSELHAVLRAMVGSFHPAVQ